ncbi:hypothetical protein BB559_006024 [Furculomyces boomerangus]|uniref:RING-type E3 ubiquitin transferase n=2 Tax=Harpellales TaxID=61421 RepID=A0A2T9Y1A1_9FUNG|nr:hypothetical protein BB559_006664 [Furculomyces boomerangus]PVU87520.1 hypothetical protein BB559_006024 [Furculomyces boomerangus]PWA00381.1 hypothetical protein BB558_003564 [Smittium angustum]
MEYLSSVNDGEGANNRTTDAEPAPSLPLSIRSQTANANSEPASQTENETKKTSKNNKIPHIRIVPHIVDVRQCLYFDVIDREVPDGMLIKVGRFTDKVSNQQSRIAFKSKVVSRSHAEIWTENGNFFIRDTRSSSGTFLNHMRLSPPGVESSPFPLKDGDILQLGVDYQGGAIDIYKCVKIRVEINRKWQRTKGNRFRKQILKNIQNSYYAVEQSQSSNSENAECCICLYNMLAFQALFVAPCSHCFHFKCVKQLLFTSSGFSCPLCRTYADLEARVPSNPDKNIPKNEHVAVDSNVIELTNQLPIAIQIAQSNRHSIDQNIQLSSNILASVDNVQTSLHDPSEINTEDMLTRHVTYSQALANDDTNTSASESGDVPMFYSSAETPLHNPTPTTPLRQADIMNTTGVDTPITTINQIIQNDQSVSSTPVGSIPTSSLLVAARQDPSINMDLSSTENCSSQPMLTQIEMQTQETRENQNS